MASGVAATSSRRSCAAGSPLPASSEHPPLPASRRSAAKRAHVEPDTEEPGAPPHEEVLARIADLSAKNVQLSADIESLKRSVAPCQLADGAAEQPPRQADGTSASTLDAIREDIDQLQQELRSCRQFVDERSQLDALRSEMEMLKQSLLQESSTSRSGIERLLSRRMSAFQDTQDDESSRLQDELDELRSELCDVLKEMHRLKERTRHLRPDCARRAKRPRDGAQLEAAASLPVLGRSPPAPLLPPADAAAHCNHPHYCRYHYPLLSDAVGVDKREDMHRSSQYRSASSSQSSSPRRPSDAAIESLELQSVEVAATRAGNQLCSSPHFSSRSSSISGRLSRNETRGPVPEEEAKRRLLEQHRLFWIKEGAGELR